MKSGFAAYIRKNGAFLLLFHCLTKIRLLNRWVKNASLNLNALC